MLNAQNAATQSGWKPMDDLTHKSRYSIKDMLDPEYEPVREFNYQYYRRGLDVMDEKVAEGRAEITKSLNTSSRCSGNALISYMYLLRLVFDAKADELVNVYSESFPDERQRAYDILTEVDKTNSNKYSAILEQSGL
ncbi:MAG: DUF4835 family protein [Bacteroidales bacterium]